MKYKYKWSVDYLVSEGILKGKSKRIFGLKDKLTYKELTNILIKVYKCSEESIESLYSTDYNSNSIVTRGELALVIYHAEHI